MTSRQLPQNKKLYDAIDAAFENYGNNQGINPHKYLADILGYTGQDKDKQIYRKLSLREPNYRFYVDELVMLCEELGVYAAPIAHFFFSFVQNSIEAPRASVGQTASIFSKSFGHFNSQLIEAMSDGSLSAPERELLCKMIDDMSGKLQRLRATLTPAEVSE